MNKDWTNIKGKKFGKKKISIPKILYNLDKIIDNIGVTLEKDVYPNYKKNNNYHFFIT